MGVCPNLSDPSPLARLGILNCYFFIAYLGFTEHEMDFDRNLFFCHTKVFWHLEKFRVQPYISSINRMQNIWKTNISKCQTYPPKNKKKGFFLFLHVWGHSTRHRSTSQFKSIYSLASEGFKNNEYSLIFPLKEAENPLPS